MCSPARARSAALLNLAASCLGPDETYVEVGVYHGASLIAAMLGHEDGRFVAIDALRFSGTSLDRIEATYRAPLAG